MTRTVTAAELEDAKMDGGTLFLDGPGFYEQHSSCKEHPALTKVRRGPKGRRSKVAAPDARASSVSVTLYVAGAEVGPSLEAVAAALTEHYARTPPAPFNFEAEMQEANEP